MRAPLSIVSSRRAFSLLEVVVAVGIFAVGMLAVVGLFTPVARSVTASSDAEAAARVAEALRAKLQTMPMADVIALLKNATSTRHELTQTDERPDYNFATDPQLLFANRNGTKIGAFNDTAVWGQRTATANPDREKFFEIALIRNEVLSPRATATEPVTGEDGTVVEPPPDPDTVASMIAYVARLRWPAFVPDAGAGAIQVGSNPTGAVRFDPSQKQVMFFPGSITR